MKQKSTFSYRVTSSLFLLICLCSSASFSQFKSYGLQVVKDLTSSEFWGRGYTKDGNVKAAYYIAEQFKQIGLQPINENAWFQPFSYAVNTFPGKMQVRVNKKLLVPGKDYIVAPDSKSFCAKGTLQMKDSNHYADDKRRLAITIKEKLTWSVAPYQTDVTEIIILKSAAPDTCKTYDICLEAKREPDFKTQNVIGYVQGTEFKDSFLVVSAHYDHLGGMGKATFFPGANDNASGMSVMLGLAQYFKQHPCKYNVLFIAFSGEEIGLLGSKYFVEHPVVNLKSIQFVMNLDLNGTGQDGICVVNGEVYGKQFNQLDSINKLNQLFSQVLKRGKASNSDHYWFSEMNIPAFFIYTLGGSKAYHDVFDTAKAIELDKYDELIRLIAAFYSTF